MAGLPAELASTLNGAVPVSETGTAFSLVTVDADGWPREAQLSAGEVLVAADGSLRICTWPRSRTTGNLRRDGRALLVAVAGGSVWQLRVRAEERPAPAGAPDLAYFAAPVESAEEQPAKYATVERGVAFRLHDPAGVHARWAAQLAALRSLA